MRRILESAAMSDLAAYRYGRKGLPLPALVIAVLIIVTLLGWLGWVIWLQTHPKVTSSLTGFDIRNDHHAVATVSVHLYDAVPASCELRAYARDHSVVAEMSVPVTEQTVGQHTMDARLRTERRATSVELLGCTSAGQIQPR